MRILNVAKIDDEGTGSYMGTFTQIKLAVEYILAVTDEPLLVNLKPFDAGMVSRSFRREAERCNITDADGYLMFSMLRSEMNPKPEETV